MAKFTKEDDTLITELGVEVTAKTKSTFTPKEERIIAGFEDIQKFVEEHQRLPSFGEDKDIFERIYATRLEQLCRQEDCCQLLSEWDHQGLLKRELTENTELENDLDDETLLDKLELKDNSTSDITSLRHVKPRSEMRPADEIGTRTPCKDFEIFKPLFQAVQADIKSGQRKVIPFNKDGSIEKGNFFILSGQKAYIAEVGQPFKGKDGRNEYRLRVIFDNGVESNQLMRSIQKRLWEDESGRRITDISMGPLFDDLPDENDISSGIIYICRSQSNHPLIKDNRNNIHKIGVTNRDINSRLSSAETDPTFLFAKADCVASFQLYIGLNDLIFGCNYL